MSTTKSSSFPNSWMFLAAIVGGAFVLQRAVEQSGKETPTVASGSQAVPTIEDTPRGRDRRMRAPLRAYFGQAEPPQPAPGQSAIPVLAERNKVVRLNPEASSTARSAGKGVDVDADLAERLRSVAQLDFLIVTVADPIDSAENYRFDLQLEALHKALAANANDDDVWVLDRYYLPWQVKDPTKTATGEQLHSKEPGVLLYRRVLQSKGPGTDPVAADKRTSDRLLLVYLVGELPTSGLHKQAFQESLEEIQYLSQARQLPTPRIMIVGPTFTGSAPSLAALLRSATASKHPSELLNTFDANAPVLPVSFSLLTGSALGIDRRLFDDLSKGDSPNLPPRVGFGATVVKGSDLRAALLEYIGSRNSFQMGGQFAKHDNTSNPQNDRTSAAKPDKKSAARTESAPLTLLPPLRVAWLTETGTGFAASSTKSVAGASIEITNFPYPLHISRVRLAYERRRTEAKAGTSSLGPKRFTVPIPFEATDVARDLPGAMTPNMTAASVDVILGQILDSIRREGIRYVGITATDIRDPIFLANVIRDHCPDVQLLLITPDQLHGHPEYQQALAGALVASSYPFFSEAQDWSFPFAGRQQTLVFSNQGTAGLFNAVLLQRYQQRYGVHQQWLETKKATATEPDSKHWAISEKVTHMPPLICYDEPLQADHEHRTHRPPVWISMVGTSGLWPMRAEAATGSTGYTVGVNYAADFHSKIAPFDDVVAVGSSIGVPHVSGRMAALTAFARGIVPLLVLVVAWASIRLGNGRGHGLGWASPFLAAETAQQRAAERKRAGDAAEEQRCRGLRRRAQVFTVIGTVPVLCILLSIAGYSFRAIDPGLSRLGMTTAWYLMHNLLFVVALVAVGAALYLAARAFGGGWRAGSTLAVAALLAYGTSTHLAGFRHERVFILIGSSDLSNGVSLLLPALLVCGVYVAFCYVKLKHLDLLIRYPVDRPGWCSWPDQRNHSHEWWEAFVRLTGIGGDTTARRLMELALVTIWCLYVWLGTVNINPQPIMFGVVLVGLIVAIIFAWVWLADVLLAASTLRSLVKNCLRQRLHETDQDPIDWAKVFGRRTLIGPPGLSGLLGSPRSRETDESLRRQREMNERLAKAEAKLNQLVDDGQAKPDELSAAHAGCREARENIWGHEIERFVRQNFVHLRTACSGLTVLAMVLFMASGSFPFNTAGLLRLSTALLLIVVALAVVGFYVALDRDEFLSRIAGTEPNQIVWDWTLLQNVGVFGLVAIVALVSQAFPEVWQWLRTFFEPLMKSTR